MDKEQIKRSVERGNFIENNGKILLVLNLMDVKERTLSNLCVVMHDVSVSDFRNSLLYLLESGYIRLDHPDGAACIEAGPLDTPVGISITSDGMELLMGIKENPAVEV